MPAMVETAEPCYRFAAGAIGAIAPEIVRLYRIASGGGPIPKFTFAYYPLSVLVIVLGGGLALMVGDPNLLKCFGVGVATPFIVSSLASQLPQMPTKP
jgi:hypothetical protein